MFMFWFVVFNVGIIFIEELYLIDGILIVIFCWDLRSGD